MLVCVWDAMYTAISQIQAQEWMDSYTVQVVASPNISNDARESILASWRRLIAGIWPVAGSKEYASDGTEIERRIMPLARVIDTIRGAFGRSIRD